MKFLGVIPARGGSKGIPGKNTKLLCGKPLIVYSIEAGLASKIDRLIVSTDSVEIAEISESHGAEIVMRPSSLAQDDTPTVDVLKDVVRRIPERYDAVVTLQPTSPLRTHEDINNCLKLFIDDQMADSLVSVVKMPHNFSPGKLMSMKGRYLVGDNSPKRRQEVATHYARNGAAIYITKLSKLEFYVYGGNILPYLMSKFSSFDIDDMDDWTIVESLIESKNYRALV
jgi:CMP-N,N'-diacetyllegionaminic acid synthase